MMQDGEIRGLHPFSLAPYLIAPQGRAGLCGPPRLSHDSGEGRDATCFPDQIHSEARKATVVIIGHYAV